ncbi:glycosyl transferase family group 2-domain-containing protein [Ilyonectria sp. MPI-CAGE-AT-0026]|nr:glycosyl transferase family group 2-domain-containing protein [Ilyonectria sp. MPI-CAGE-AT-0026]
MDTPESSKRLDQLSTADVIGEMDDIGVLGSQGDLHSSRPKPVRPLSQQFMSPSSSRANSRAASLHEATLEEPGMVAKYLSRRATLLGLFDEPERQSLVNGFNETCVAVKTADDDYVFQPTEVNPLLALAIARIDNNAVMSMSSEVLPSIIDSIQPGQRQLVIEPTGMKIPIVESLEEVHSSLTMVSRACIVVRERVMLVWSNDPRTIVNSGHDIETQLLGLSFNPDTDSNTRRTSRRSSVAPQSHRRHYSEPVVRGGIDEKNEVYKKAVALEEGDGEDVESAVPPRPRLRIHAFKIGFAIMLVIVTQSLAVSKLLNQYMWDGGKLRFALAATIPPLALFSLFFFINLVTGFFQILAPVSSCLKNSKFHSAIKPNPKRHANYELPHITIQMPVYKEGLKGVIVPTMVSVMAAIQHYEEKGGTASVFINDDGMQCIHPELAEARQQYYRENDIGYTARLPNRKIIKKKSAAAKEGEEKVPLTPQDMANHLGFERKGKFKKASNMNYGLAFSNRVEDEMSRLLTVECERRGCSDADLTVDEDEEIYQQALQNILAEDEGRTWADGNIRIGELILIIDCDTRVPVDCLLYAALEMRESPEVAILQHGSGVMQVAHNLFENGITYFTNVVYTAIRYGVGSGDVAPFVGHNAILRWKAIQSIAFVDPSDGQTKWWSDAHVSEDFDISLRLQMAGMTVRLATYHNGEFKEGVSLTLYDELTRWEKYAYGCNELVFHPFYKWIYKGPVTRLFLRFLWSNIPITSKITIVAYIFTYYAIASGMFLTIVNYFVIGLFPDEIDHVYQPSWGIWISLVVVFNGFGSVTFSVLRRRMNEAPFWKALWESVKWLPFLIIFFGGISLNCAKALLCHALSIDIEWASTAKEVGPTGFSIGLDKMVKTFKYTWAICLILTGGMIYMAIGAPWGWNITPGPHSTATIAIVPLAIQMCSAFFLPFCLGLL